MHQSAPCAGPTRRRRRFRRRREDAEEERRQACRGIDEGSGHAGVLAAGRARVLRMRERGLRRGGGASGRRAASLAHDGVESIEACRRPVAAATAVSAGARRAGGAAPLRFADLLDEAGASSKRRCWKTAASLARKRRSLTNASPPRGGRMARRVGSASAARSGSALGSQDTSVISDGFLTPNRSAVKRSRSAKGGGAAARRRSRC